MTLADASDVAPPTWIGSAAAASNAAPEGMLAVHAPSPLTAHQRRPSAGADSTATTISPSTSRAIAVAHPGRPREKLCVPSMPSRIHRLAAITGLRADLLADDRIGGTLSTKHVEHRLFGVEIDLRDRGPVRLVDRRQVLAGEVRHRDGVGTLGEREGQCELAGPRGHHTPPQLHPAGVATTTHVRWARRRALVYGPMIPVFRSRRSRGATLFPLEHTMARPARAILRFLPGTRLMVSWCEW